MDSVTYPLGNGEQLGFDRVAKLKTGTVPVDEAAERFEAVWDEVFSSSSSLEPVGDSGNQLVAMRKYRYEQRAGQATPARGAAFDRAVATLGFLMF